MGKFSPRNLIKVPGRKSYHDMILEEAGLVSYWNFGAGAGNKARDQKDTNHGTISGATWTQKSNGIWTLDFDGDNDYVTIADSASLDSIDSTQEITVAVWAYPHTFDRDVLSPTLISKFHNNVDEAWQLFILFDTGTPALTISDTAGAGSADSILANNAIPLNQWSHLAGIYDGTNLEIYINGVLDNSKVAGNGVRSGDADVSIGRAAGGNGSFNGLINEVVIYDAALTPETILKHYQVGVWEGLAT